MLKHMDWAHYRPETHEKLRIVWMFDPFFLQHSQSMVYYFKDKENRMVSSEYSLANLARLHVRVFPMILVRL